MSIQLSNLIRDVIAGATGRTTVAPKFSYSLTLSQPRGADSNFHCRSQVVPVVMFLHHDQIG